MDAFNQAALCDTVAKKDQEEIMREAIVRELWTYPVKSCQGVPAQTLEIKKMGVQGDRSFVLWQDGQLVEQKETPLVASVAATFDREAGTLRFTHASQGEYLHHIRSDGEKLDAKWILDEFKTLDQGDAVAEWLSRAVDKQVRLVSPGETWKVNFPIPQFEGIHGEPKQSFYSASPVSLANQASLDDLNARLEAPIRMDRFRVNLVLDGLDPYEEDHIQSVSNDAVALKNMTAAERCIIIDTDQETGKRTKSGALKALGQYRRKEKKDRFGSGIQFSSYMAVEREGELRVGDRLLIS
jgi:uncharacterized protein YcbX